MLLYTGEWINYGLSWPMFLKPLAPCHLISATAEMFNTASVHAIGILDARSLVPLLVRRFAPSVGICWPSKLELATPVDKPHGPSLCLRIRKNKTPVFGQTWLFPSSDKQKKTGPPGFCSCCFLKVGELPYFLITIVMVDINHSLYIYMVVWPDRALRSGLWT